MVGLRPRAKTVVFVHQQVKGSVDEKYPFLVNNIQKSKIDTIIVLDGKGYKPGAEKWLKAQVKGYLKKVIDIEKFQQLSKEGFFR